jgi:hypothetical protein
VTGLARALQAWDTPAFAPALKAALLGLGPGVLPLQAATVRGGQVDAGDMDLTVLASRDAGAEIQVNVGVFFVEVMGGCSCGDEPVAHPAYCRLRVCIDKASAAARFELLQD